MPELPDVETYRRYVDSTSLRQPVTAVHVGDASIVRGTSVQGLGRRLHGHTFAHTRRHGKYLFVERDSGGWLVLHFGMTGRLDYSRAPAGCNDEATAAFEFDNDNCLAYIAPRKLGMISWVEAPDELIERRKLGPDVLSLTREAFVDLAAGRRMRVKCWLMDQRTMAGLGNVYSDEILFHARMDPAQPVDEIGPQRLGALFKSLRAVLAETIAAKADPDALPNGYLLRHRQRGSKCPRCRGQLDTRKLCGRTAWLCPSCQRAK